MTSTKAPLQQDGFRMPLRQVNHNMPRDISIEELSSNPAYRKPSPRVYMQDNQPSRGCTVGGAACGAPPREQPCASDLDLLEGSQDPSYFDDVVAATQFGDDPLGVVNHAALMLRSLRLTARALPRPPARLVTTMAPRLAARKTKRLVARLTARLAAASLPRRRRLLSTIPRMTTRLSLTVSSAQRAKIPRVKRRMYLWARRAPRAGARARQLIVMCLWTRRHLAKHPARPVTHGVTKRLQP